MQVGHVLLIRYKKINIKTKYIENIPTKLVLNIFPKNKNNCKLNEAFIVLLCLIMCICMHIKHIYRVNPVKKNSRVARNPRNRKFIFICLFYFWCISY